MDSIVNQSASGREVKLSEECVGRYVLVTAAYNEEKYIERTIQSIISQTAPPLMWVIVSDGSTDRTDDIVSSYSRSYPFVRLLRLVDEHPRDFAAQAAAIRTGCKAVEDLEYDFIGNLDADITLDPSYFERLLTKFDENLTLGLAGGSIYEEGRSGFENRPTNSQRSVPHALQLFRRNCFQVVGGYRTLRFGGPDWVAEVMARRAGWEVCSFLDLPAYHWRPTTSAEGLLRGCWREGCMDYSIGSLMRFEILKCARRFHRKPYVIGSVVRMLAFSALYLQNRPREMPDDFVSYLQDEQRNRLSLFSDKPGRTRPAARDNH
jgi:poly-beta-1,6-N-acetyl-D-glucosamine synthase